MHPAKKPSTETRSPLKGFLPFLWMSLSCTAGILLGDVLSLPTWIWGSAYGLAVLALILALTLPKSWLFTHRLRTLTGAERRLPSVLLAAVFLLGGLLLAATKPDITPKHTAYYNDRGAVQLIGTVVDAPDPRDNGLNLTVAVTSLRPLEAASTQVKPLEVTGKVLVQVPPGENWHYGDRLRITGELQTPYEGADFSYREYLARNGIHSLMSYAGVTRLGSGEGKAIRAWLYQLREKGYRTLQQLFPAPESDLLAGILLGRDQGLSPQLEEAFQRTGTTHIIAISGFNIAILAGLVTDLTTRLLGRRWGALASLAAIGGYTILVGADAAVVRAAVMGGLGVFGGMFGRRQNGLNSLGLAALLMMLLDPNILWDVGFQLSVAATLGLVLYAQPLEDRTLLWLGKWMSEEHTQQLIGVLSECILFTVIAQVMTLPVMAYHFGGVSWLALIANPLILPAQSLVMILGGLALLAGLVLPGAGAVLAVLAKPFVTYTIRVVTWLAGGPGGEWVLPRFHPIWLLLFYGLLFFLTLIPRTQQKALIRKALSPQLGLLALTGLVTLTWSHILGTPDNLLHLTLIDEQGTVLIQSPSGNTALIGGGDRPSALNQALGEMLPSGRGDLDALIVGSAYRDDLNALTGSPAAQKADLVLWGIDPEASQTAATAYAALENGGASIRPLVTGQRLDLDKDIHLAVLWVGERGAVLWLSWADFSALIPTGKVEAHWLDVPAAPDVILLPDGLKAEDLPLPTINTWEPSVVLLPLSESDLPLHGSHPLSNALADYPLLDTLDHDWIRIKTDGHRLWVSGGN
ncbi:ComEC family competence protein [bacterium]|nr:ComEC family competence protein [bacterium]